MHLAFAGQEWAQVSFADSRDSYRLTGALSARAMVAQKVPAWWLAHQERDESKERVELSVCRGLDACQD
jgi:hypothetical protein